MSQRFKMLTGWITVTAFLAASAGQSAAVAQHGVTVAPTCRVKGRSEGELTLNCGDGKSSGVVQFWHTPFGDFEASGFLDTLDPVYVHKDGSLVVPNTSSVHSGLYYCVLKHSEGSTLWPYELSVGHDIPTDTERTTHELQSCGAFRYRSRRDVRSEKGRQGGVSDEQFAGAVVASVLLTFVAGFSAGALSRTRVLRCLGAINVKIKSRQRQADTPDHGLKVSTPTRPVSYDNEAVEMEEVVLEEESAMNVTTESTVSSTTSSPPAKPQRSFRQKREEEPETAAYLEGCDYMRVEKEETKKEEEETDLKEKEEKEVICSFYISEKDEESHDGTEEEQKDGAESREEEEADEVKVSSSSDGDEEDRTGSEEEENEEIREGLEKEEDAVMSEEKQEDAEEEPAPRPPRRSRIIRLYQYDEDGQRYGHLPNPTPDEPSPAPRLKQRSLSLTRLNAIMAASAGPLDTRETGQEEEKPHFQMMI